MFEHTSTSSLLLFIETMRTAERILLDVRWTSFSLSLLRRWALLVPHVSVLELAARSDPCSKDAPERGEVNSGGIPFPLPSDELPRRSLGVERPRGVSASSSCLFFVMTGLLVRDVVFLCEQGAQSKQLNTTLPYKAPQKAASCLSP